MRDSDDSSEVEPLVPQDQIRGLQKGSKFQVAPQHIPIIKDLRSLEIVTVFVVTFDTHQGQLTDRVIRFAFQFSTIIEWHNI